MADVFNIVRFSNSLQSLALESLEYGGCIISFVIDVHELPDGFQPEAYISFFLDLLWGS